MTDKPPSRPPPAPGLNLSLADIYYILFRHKWKIALISGCGILAALLLPIVKPVPYESEAKLYVRYVLETKSPSQLDGNDPRIKSPDSRGDSIINTELEILTSLDLAQQVADTIGPEKLLSRASGGTNRYWAAGLVRKNLTAEVSKNSSVIRITFKHPNEELVQPVLTELIDLYFKKHNEVHAVDVYDDMLTQETDQLRASLAIIEQELIKAKTNLGPYRSPEDAGKFQGEQISRIRQLILAAEAERAERKVAANELARAANGKPLSATNIVSLPPDKVTEYKTISVLLDSLRRKEQELLPTYKPENSLLKGIQQRIAENALLKKKMEEENPGLLTVAVSEGRSTEPGVNSRPDLPAEMARVAALDSKISFLNEQLEQIQKEAAAVNNAEGTITRLQLRKEFDEARLKNFARILQQARTDVTIGKGKATNFSPIQEPSPPYRDGSKMKKARIAVVFAGMAAAFALAFLIELFLDRSLKRSAEIEPKLGLSLFLSIPLVHQNGALGRLKWLSRMPLLRHRNGHGETNDRDANGNGHASTIVEEPDVPHSQLSTLNSELSLTLRPFFDGLRDRLITFFEIKNLTHKPKLVAVTSCGEGSGVSTIAAGLAASLSRTGDGNVLLVDMNNQQGAAHRFHHGVHCGLDDALEIEKRSGALVQDNLYVVAESGNGDKPVRFLPRHFTNLVPRLKASDFDYIIFDMPPISQISVTPGLARFMDMIFLVIESEKTDRDVVKRAAAFLGESKPNLCAILNKNRTYVPKLLQQEL